MVPKPSEQSEAGSPPLLFFCEAVRLGALANALLFAGSHIYEDHLPSVPMGLIVAADNDGSDAGGHGYLFGAGKRCVSVGVEQRPTAELRPTEVLHLPPVGVAVFSLVIVYKSHVEAVHPAFIYAAGFLKGDIDDICLPHVELS